MALFEGAGGNRGGAEDFWNNTEADIGEPVVAFGLAQYLSGGGEEGPLWGLVYLTETRLFFRHFPQSGWFRALMTTTSDSSREQKKRPTERDITLVWPLTQFSGIAQQEPRRGWRRLLFGTNSTPITLLRAPITPDAASTPDPVVFTVENNRAEVLAALERALGSTER